MFQLQRLQNPTGQLTAWVVPLLISAWAIRFVLNLFYNYYLNPLRRVPGPRAARVLSSYMTPPTAKGRRAQTLRRLHDEYGPYVRIGPREVSISNYELYRQIYNHTASVKTDEFYSGGALLGQENTFSMRNKKQHAARRKMQNQSYSQQSINANEPVIAEMVGRLIERMTRNKGTVNVYEFCGLFGLEVICRVAFDEDIGTEEDALSLLQCLGDSGITLSLRSILPFLMWRPLRRYLGEFLPGHLGHAFSQRRKWEEEERRLFRDFSNRQKHDPGSHFLATPFLTHTDEFLGRRLNENEAVEEAMGLTFAGSGTTATTIVYILYYLSRPENIAMQVRLRQEVATSPPTLFGVKDLPYLNAVIKEAMRISPSLVGSLPRKLVTDLIASKADGIVLPAGTVVSMQNYVHQRDPTVYENPNHFLPERWLGIEASSSLEMALTPFGLGPRNCIGQNLAKAELLLAVSSIFRKLAVSLEPEMKASDMEIVDRFAGFPFGKRLLLQVTEL